MLNIKRFIFNPFAENTYILWNDQNKEAAIVDPGCCHPEEKEIIDNFISSNQLNLKYLINTHCHLDHIFGNCHIKRNYEVDYLIPEQEKQLLNNAPQQAAMFGIEINEICQPDNFISEAIALSIGGSELNFLFTPGHSPGGYSIYCKQEKFCITGDALFEGSIGRTDLPGGNHKLLLYSIKQKLFTLPFDTIIYPGHGESSTIGKETQTNPFFN